MGLNHSDINDRMFLYGCVRRWNRETLKELNFDILPESPIEEKEYTYKKFLEKSWLEKKPFGYFNYGAFYTPLKYVQYEAILNRQAIRALLGLATSVREMATKGMFLNGKVDANILLSSINSNLKAIDVSEKDLNNFKQLGLDLEHYSEE
ncbi:hypothetical protein LCGC14_2062340 [marine sediment metagenome]|uniref:Uncharacterized protein n=1 Tax=marine sediment metagenome TaxID=412755 RepID=A0A0F9HHQ9_9ZZZZ